MRSRHLLALVLVPMLGAACSTPVTTRRAAPIAPRVAPPAGPPTRVTAADLQRVWRFDLPSPRLRATDLRLRLWATYYYVPQVQHVRDGFALRDVAGRELGPRLNRRDWCDAAMQGTVFVATGEGEPLSLNFAGAPPGPVDVDCTSIYPRHPAIGRSRFQRSEGPYGDGAQGLTIVPFRSIAVDPRVVPIGTVLFVPSARGTPLTLPTGEQRVHDGYFFAADRGGAIRGRHIDVFLGPTADSPFEFVRSHADGTFAAYPVRSAEITDMMWRAHRLAPSGTTAARG